MLTHYVQRVVDYIGRRWSNRDKAKTTTMSQSLDKFFSKIFADRRRPRAYDLWGGEQRYNQEYKDAMEEQLTKMYGSAENRSINERNAARRYLFEQLSDEEQLTYVNRAEQWKSDASKPDMYVFHSLFEPLILTSLQGPNGGLDSLCVQRFM